MNGIEGNSKYYLSQTINLVEKIVSYAIATNDHHEIKYAFKILSGVLESSKGKINDLIPEIVNYTSSQIDIAKKKDHKNALIELV